MTPETARPPVDASEPPFRAKVRFRFQKAGDLRLVSHHDLMHCFERMFRRAGLPVPRTQGFNPRPRMWFAQSLALGLVGLREVLELELSEPLSAEEVLERLSRQCPPGLAIDSAKLVGAKASGQVRRAWYRMPLATPVDGLPERIAAFLQETSHWVERSRPQKRRFDLRPYVNEVQARADGLHMNLWVTPNGAGRPEEVAVAVGLGDLVQQGAVLERTDLELFDELTEEAALIPMPTFGKGAADPGPDTQSLHESEPSDNTAPEKSRPTAIFAGPLSFDT